MIETIIVITSNIRKWDYNVFIETSIPFCQLRQKVHMMRDASFFEAHERRICRVGRLHFNDSAG